MSRRNLLLILIFTALQLGILLLGYTSTAQAVTKSDWRAGNIVSDSVFYNNNSMSVDQIQSFLNSKNPNCDTWGTQPAAEFGRPDISRASYAQAAGWHSPPYICLKDYHQVPRSDTVIDNYNASATPPAGSWSAAQIIKNASDSYGVSPQALLVLLQKESAGPLPVDIWPLKSQYKNAMGYACPDTAPCDPQFAGFYNQVTNAAKRIQTYKLNPNSYRHKPFAWNNQVYYNPNLNGCGWSAVYIEGYATAGLYNYTPYQPNEAALNNMYGTGDNCSAYGNRNFWRIFNDWFDGGNTPWSPLLTPRILVTNKDTYKINPFTKQATQSLPAGQTIKFQTKNGECLRTQHDTERNNDACVEMKNLDEFKVNQENINSDGSLVTQVPTQWTCKVDYIRQEVTDQCFDPSDVIATFQKKITVLDTEYIITERDVNSGQTLGFKSDRFRKVSY